MIDLREQFEVSNLSNGITLYFCYIDRPWVGMSFVIHSGAIVEVSGQEGLAHLAEHCVSRSIPGYDVRGVKQFFKWCGGTVNLGVTNYFSTYYGFRVPLDALVEATKTFGLMLGKGVLGNALDTEKQIILEEFRRRYLRDENLFIALRKAASVYNGHPRLCRYDRPIGNPKSFMGLASKDLQDFYDAHYTPQNMSIVSMGPFTAAQLKDILEESDVGALVKSGSRTPLPVGLFEVNKPTESRIEYTVADLGMGGIKISGYTMEFALPACFHPQKVRVFLNLIDDLLFHEVREKEGLSYDFGTSWVNYLDVYKFQLGGTIHDHAIGRIEDLVWRCVRQIPQGKNLFERERERLIKLCSMEDRSCTQILDDVVDDITWSHNIVALKEIERNLQNVCFEDMAEIVGFLIPERACITVVRQ